MEAAATNPRTAKLPPRQNSRAALQDLFNLYLGRSYRNKGDDEAPRETPTKLQKRISALNRELPPRNEQFLFDFEQLQAQFPDQEHLRSVTESVIINLVVQCSSHAPQAEFLLFSLRALSDIGYINWDTFIPSLLSSVSSAEISVGQGNQAMTANNLAAHGNTPSSVAISTSTSFQSFNPSSPLPSLQGMGSPPQGSTDLAASVTQSPKPNDTGQQIGPRTNGSLRRTAFSWLRQLSCKIILIALECNLKPLTHAEIFQHMLNWLASWDQRQDGVEEFEVRLHEWLHSCLDVVWVLVEEDRCRIPFYELLRSGLQFMDNIPDDEALFTMVLEIHRRRDKVAMHMQMLDQHLHCPTFANLRFPAQTYPSLSGEPLANLRSAPLTYPSGLGEPLHGEDLAACIQRGSLDWERAIRCLKHALNTTPSPDWWRRVLVTAPCYRQQAQQQVSVPGIVFSSEMLCEVIIDRIMDLLKSSNSDNQAWQEWLIFSDLFHLVMKSGYIDFLDFVEKLTSRFAKGNQQIRSNHVTWLLVQIISTEIVMNTLNADPKKVDTMRKIVSFHKEDRSSDQNNVTPQGILLDFISSSLTSRVWSLTASIREYLNPEQLQKGKQIDEWWKQVKGERMLDFLNLDERSLGMFWVLSHTVGRTAWEAIMAYLNSVGVSELLQQGSMGQSGERMMVMREACPLPMSLFSGLSINSSLKLATQIEETLLFGQVIPSIAVVETYARLLLTLPHSLFRLHFNVLTQRAQTITNKPGVYLLLLEILNYRLLPLYRYHNKTKTLMYDVTKIISMTKAKRGEHRLFRLAENLCMNLILSIRDVFLVKKELKGPTDFTETLNRVAIISLAITIKTRGIAEIEHLLFLPPLLEQIMATSQHTWSEKTLRHFPPLVRDCLMGRMDKRSQAIQAWQQGRVLRELSPEEVTSNIYTMVDVLLHHIQIELQHGHVIQDLLINASVNLTFFIWTNELLPLDILLLALTDRDDDPHALRLVVSLLLDRQDFQQRVKVFCMNRGLPEHWQNSGPLKRLELQKALGNHLSGKERYPTFFDDIVARMLPVIPLIIYRLIENDATDTADRVLATYSAFLAYHPLRFTFVRDILAYFYDHIPSKLIVRILNVLDYPKIPFSESFPQHIGPSNSGICPPPEYFASLLLGLVNNVIPPLNSKTRSGSTGDMTGSSSRSVPNKTQTTQSMPMSPMDGQKAFYQIQDPGTHTQLVLETAVIEILSLPVTASQIVSSLVQIVVHVQPTLIQSTTGVQGAGQSSGLPTSPSGGSTDSLNTTRSAASSTGISTSNFVSRSGYTCQPLSCLMIQACGLLLSQLPPAFHVQLYAEASRIIKDCWWLTDTSKSSRELDSAVGYALCDPTWAAQDNTSTAVGNTVALLHSFFSNLPQEWLEGTHAIIKHLRPVTSVAMLRIAFRIMGPLLPRFAFARQLFMKTLALLFNVMADVLGRNSQLSTPTEFAEISDLIDFLHHAVISEGQGTVQSNTKPRPETLTLCGKAVEMLRPELQHLLCHLKPDPNSSVYAATHPKLAQSSNQ
ncbi:mediator of RNA polymerase II transcription subunit 23 isoform X2 [Amborella trichopoda]|uniref:mediator of RNA polymerase II transcription subunit 23 isoform X2 n=1 Tax=Amborella trichopoda TaxID=13333 RepID=UPI0009C0B650|nr:mediator of RNA polymerase II transcription subunit 23 isoform X2 [Amborella trichopoda]|eukprot:XP_020531801.1 mediator of RNA polymerase II transcription subunit 23 isoform X2 [Amborella trichopoda]